MRLAALLRMTTLHEVDATLFASTADSRVAGRRLLIVGTMALLVLSVMLNVGLARKLVTSRQTVGRTLALGATLRPFDGASVIGQRVRVAYDGRQPTIIYHFSPTCGWCERNWDNVRALISQTTGRYRFVGVSKSRPTTEFMRERTLGFEVVADLPDEIVRSYGLGGTPETIVVSEGGRVLKTWFGVYDGAQLKEIESYLRMRLPGIASPRPRPGSE
jgi:peroxiredoxin